MQIGFYTSKNSAAILVVLDFENWQDETISKGFCPEPVLVRKGTTPELEAFYERKRSFPAWEYKDFNELLDDELCSGVSRKHLDALLELKVRVIDSFPEPQKAQAS